MSGCGDPNCTNCGPNRPGVLKILWRTWLFEQGRRMVERAVPSAYVAVAPPQQTLEQAFADLAASKKDKPANPKKDSTASDGSYV
jgi:hypothetical protein